MIEYHETIQKQLFVASQPFWIKLQTYIAVYADAILPA